MRLLTATAVLCLLGLGAASGGDQAPDFELPDLKGETVHLAEINADRPVLVSFWATWCVPCPEEMKHLQRFYDQYREAGFTILAISIDGTKTVSKVKSFVQGRRFTYPVLLDTNNDVKRRYHVKAVPTVYLLAPGGEVVYHHVGYRPGDELALGKQLESVMQAHATRQAKPAGAEASADAPEAEASTTQAAQPE